MITTPRVGSVYRLALGFVLALMAAGIVAPAVAATRELQPLKNPSAKRDDQKLVRLIALSGAPTRYQRCP